MHQRLQLLKKQLLNPSVLLVLYIVFAIVASMQDYILAQIDTKSMGALTYYNNYIIFINSFHHLINGLDLYIYYPTESLDLYKYSPAFSLFFGIFAILPHWLGLSLWDIFNAVILFYAVSRLSMGDKLKSGLMLLLIIVEALTSFQTHQSNALMAGLVILAWVMMEKNRLFAATGLLMATGFIKLFGIVGFMLFLFYPQKWKTILYSIFWFLFFALIPLIVTDYQTLWMQYQSWGRMLANDHSSSYGISVMGWLHAWFGLDSGKMIILLMGTLGLILPLIKWKLWKETNYKLLVLSSILIWTVIFNHKAESPTFVIAMVGTAIWFSYSPKSRLNQFLMVFAIVFTSFSPTDFFPDFLREKVFVPYAVKVVPMIVVWIKINIDLWSMKPKTELEETIKT